MNTHTPTPWRISKDEPRKIVSDSIYGLDPLTGENLVGGASAGPYAVANAAFIVKAVNSYASLIEEREEMVKALRDAANRLESAAIASGTAPEYAAISVEKYRALLSRIGEERT